MHFSYPTVMPLTQNYWVLGINATTELNAELELPTSWRFWWASISDTSPQYATSATAALNGLTMGNDSDKSFWTVEREVEYMEVRVSEV